MPATAAPPAPTQLLPARRGALFITHRGGERAGLRGERRDSRPARQRCTLQRC